ncbi:response regulator [Azospirillum halopraeferens]|uniref:response regulator n=1 Tax=Azospirillum halopraeferens TaxID=34010 RepID=UPI000412A251|nr:response regulator [Azospirillum halopraeferens]
MASDSDPSDRVPDTVAAGDAEAGAPPSECREADDFYAPAARESIGRHCERILNENALTPTEVLHSPRHQNTLSNQALFVGILQQVDRVMGRKPGSINVLVNEVARLTRERTRDWTVPDLTAQNYAAIVKGVFDTVEAFRARFTIDAALTQHLHTGRSFAEKTGLLLDLAAGTDDADALAPIDRLLGEIMRCESGMASVSGDLAFAPLVDAIAGLAAGDAPLPEDAPPLLRRLEELLRRVPMPVACDGLLAALRRELGKPDRLTTASRGDLLVMETVQREALALGALGQRLRTGNGGYLGGARTEAALQRRMSLLINEDTLPELVRGRNFFERLQILFMVQRMPLSPSSQRAVNAYLMQYFQGRDFAGRLLDCWKEKHDKLKGLGEVQRMVLDSSFPDEDRDALVRQIDDMQNAFIRTQRILTPLTGKDDPSPDQVLEVVKLAGERAFCQGKSRMAVARALYRQVHRPRFLRAFLLSVSGARERAQRVAWLRNALGMVAVPFIDLSALRVLVVDDEEGPRNYVASVLRDLGIGTIETAVDGRDALDRFVGREEGVDLVICDWMMPKTSGLEVLNRVRVTRPDLPFLMVTALATRKAVERAIASHVSGYIAKPFTPDQLEEKVLLVLAQKTAPAG